MAFVKSTGEVSDTGTRCLRLAGVRGEVVGLLSWDALWLIAIFTWSSTTQRRLNHSTQDVTHPDSSHSTTTTHTYCFLGPLPLPTKLYHDTFGSSS